ncbi:MAG TPA: hypothetical protein VE223_01950, partial [Nitrososphaeraceae archaeon]|nr:hypothetical protein [Nitrososphaeraceae archaeon]
LMQLKIFHQERHHRLSQFVKRIIFRYGIIGFNGNISQRRILAQYALSKKYHHRKNNNPIC